MRKIYGFIFATSLILSMPEAVIASGLPQCSSGKTMCFTGELRLDPNPNDNTTRLIGKDFGFVDRSARGWQTNAGDVTNGASIPIWLHWVVGDPYDPAFVPAAAIHDRYCDKELKRRVYDWKLTHRMFYEALLATGVSKNKARLMYYAVYTFGPRWKKTDPGSACRGNLTPACLQFRIGDPDTVSTQPNPDNPEPVTPESLERLMQIYSGTKLDDGSSDIDLYRTAIFDDKRVEPELRAVETILEATYSAPDAELNTIDQDMAFIEQLSDTRNPTEAILLITKEADGGQR